MGKLLDLLLINSDGVNEVHIEKHDIKTMYEIIGCECFTCVSRKIGKKVFDLWIDDEGLFKVEKDGTIIGRGICGNAYECLAGNILIARHKGADMDSLSDSDIALIKNNIGMFEEDTFCNYATNIGELVMKFEAYKPLLKYNV